jgi:hypothetical protein
MTPAQRTEYNAGKQQRIHDRKEAAIAQAEKELGGPVHPRTMTVVVNPDTRTADIYSFDGFHDFIGWRSSMAADGYIGSVKYDHPGASKRRGRMAS